MRAVRLAAATGLGVALAPGITLACALELVLAHDVSGSVGPRDYALQQSGMAAAFRDAAVQRAVAGLEGGMIVVVTQWSGLTRQHQATGWHRVSGPESLGRLAETVEGLARPWRNFSTAIGEMLIHAEAVSATAPLHCEHRVIDVSGDGVSNEGRAPGPVAARLAAAGYTINGLVIRGERPDPVPHYAEQVIAGPGAFVEVAADFDDYPRAFRRKLLREIDPPVTASRRP